MKKLYRTKKIIFFRNAILVFSLGIISPLLFAQESQEELAKAPMLPTQIFKKK